MVEEKNDRKRGSKARKAPLSGTRYTAAELNAPVRGFPTASAIWDANSTTPVLLNPEQTIHTSRVRAEGERVETEANIRFLKIDDELVFPSVVMLRAHLLLRKYKTSVTVERLRLHAVEGLASEHLYGWHLSPWEKRRSVALLNTLYGSDAVTFRRDACALYQTKFGEWLSRMATLRRAPQSISLTDAIVRQLSTECSIIEILRRALGDAEASASEWFSILSGKHAPSLNKLHRIVNPKQDGVSDMTSKEMFVTSVVVSMFGCVNAAQVYPVLLNMEEIFHILCFFGRINLGELSPTVHEARAYMKHCDEACDGAMAPAARDILKVADSLCGWTKFRTVLVDLCSMTIEAHDAGRSLPPRFGRLWPMV